MKKAGLGFLTIAMGHRRYLRQAEILSMSLRRNMPGIPLAIVTDSPDLAGSADIVIPPKADIPVGVLQKVFLDQYTPFSETLFIDSDCVVARPFHDELEQIRKYQFTPATESFTPASGSDEYIADLARTLKMVGSEKLPKFNGGVYFFKDGDVASSIFQTAREMHRDYREYGIRTFDSSGPGEETVIALALAKLGLLDLYHDGGNLMRAPTGLKGKIFIDPLGGGCSFERFNGKVTPAICHFAGPYLLTAEYKLAAYSLENDVSTSRISGKIRAMALADAQLDRIKKFVEYKIHGIRKRLNPQRWSTHRP